PLFFYLSAVMTRVFGVGYAALRMVSILATLGSCTVLAVMTYRETRNRTAALASAGLFAMLYSLVLSWYDIGRVDSLSIFFFLLALFCMRFSHPVLAAVVWVLAFQTKQSFLPLAVLAFFAGWQRPKRLVLGLASFGCLAAGSIWWLNHTSGGWYSYYVFGSVKELGPSFFYAKTYIPYDLVQPLALALVLMLFAVWLQPNFWRTEKGHFYGYLTLLIVAGVWFARAHVGSYFNTLLPVYAWLCLLFGLALDRVARQLPSLLGPAQTSAAPLQFAWPALIWLIAFAQIALHLYRPGSFAMSADTERVRWNFIHHVHDTPGDVWLVNHSYDTILAGKGMHAEMDAFDAVLGRPDAPSVAELQQAIRDHRFTAIVLDRVPDTYSPDWVFNDAAFRSAYPLRAFAPGAPMPGTGDQPVLIFLPCNPAPAASLALPLDRTFVQQSGCTH
ncbi:MAG: DUF2029 domain-containing protein, partial [Rhodospirillales bacterium]|nr:DUF2029 domain-containing protein [Acetobacter sp.]